MSPNPSEADYKKLVEHCRYLFAEGRAIDPHTSEPQWLYADEAKHHIKQWLEKFDKQAQADAIRVEVEIPEWEDEAQDESEYRADTFVFKDALRQILESSDMDEIKTIVVSVMPQYDLEGQLEAVKARIERGAKLAGWSHGFDEKGELHPSLADLQSLPVIDEYYRLKKEIASRDQS